MSMGESWEHAETDQTGPLPPRTYEHPSSSLQASNARARFRVRMHQFHRALPLMATRAATPHGIHHQTPLKVAASSDIPMHPPKTIPEIQRDYISPHPKFRPRPKSTNLFNSRFFLRPSLRAVMTRITRRKGRKKTKKSARKTTHHQQQRTSTARLGSSEAGGG
jgi:hypothetical protein